METSNLIIYVPPVLFSLVAECFFLLWHLKLSDTWYWGAGFAQTSLGFVISTFSIQPTLDAFATITVCMLFPVSARAAIGHTALERY